MALLLLLPNTAHALAHTYNAHNSHLLSTFHSSVTSSHRKLSKSCGRWRRFRGAESPRQLEGVLWVPSGVLPPIWKRDKIWHDGTFLVEDFRFYFLQRSLQATSLSPGPKIRTIGDFWRGIFLHTRCPSCPPTNISKAIYSVASILIQTTKTCIFYLLTSQLYITNESQTCRKIMQ